MRALVWPELDQLLRDEEDGVAATPYTAVVLEYRVVFHDQTDSSLLDRIFSMSNGHASYDVQHPCRANVSVKRELHTLKSDRSCTHLEFDISHTGLTLETESFSYLNAKKNGQKA
ncbi:NADPH--cytochrome P450 reductase 1-like isoform X2 [Apium graveolens]|uniref:NADPH--cytochrome P450 reductase 1-like isoform X2 n=1 Tax=Apium graveolens TaxID=4045 RepID=UPI003D795031